MSPLVPTIRAALRDAAEPERAPAMQAYMKSAMPYLGVRLPVVRSLARKAVRGYPPETLDDLEAAVRTLWDDVQFREERYAACELLDHPLATGQLELVPVYEHLATSGAWWDHVDALSHRIGDLHDVHPVETAALVRAWSTHDDRWLRRLAIISQLSRKDRLDTAVLTDTIEPNVTDTEFFIRKAIGWALRQHARVDPAWVRTFVAEHDGLSGLSKREALKHLKQT